MNSRGGNSRSRWPIFMLVLGIAFVSSVVITPAPAEDKSASPTKTAADQGSDFKPYTQEIPGYKPNIQMVPIPGGTFLMGSPEDEAERLEDEGPQLEVTVSPFWMSTHEIPWELYDIYSFQYDIKDASKAKTPRTKNDTSADAVSRPTPPYVDMTFGYGHDGYPAICMTHHAARKFCQWLSAKTGHYYRLPTEAEWEYAARAGTKGLFSFGDDPEKLGDYGWYYDNSNGQPQPIGKKKPNPWGLYDMHGNVSEWTVDVYEPDYFKKFGKGPVTNPVWLPEEELWHAVKGGSFEDDPLFVRSAIRRGSDDDWSIQDPQIPKSIWYHTDAHFVGFRVVRPLDPENDPVRKALEKYPELQDEKD